MKNFKPGLLALAIMLGISCTKADIKPDTCMDFGPGENQRIGVHFIAAVDWTITKRFDCDTNRAWKLEARGKRLIVKEVPSEYFDNSGYKVGTVLKGSFVIKLPFLVDELGYNL